MGRFWLLELKSGSIDCASRGSSTVVCMMIPYRIVCKEDVNRET